MAAVRVFVDDAILGRLPPICIRTGQPSDMTVRTSRAAGGGLGALWLLVLLGPPGWVGLVLLALVLPGGERLTVELPYSRSAWDHERRVRGCFLAFFGLGLVAFALMIVHPGPFLLLWPVLAGGLLLAGGVLWTVAYMRDTGVYLDASRRWVTLSRVHPDFARAAERREAQIVRR